MSTNIVILRIIKLTMKNNVMIFKYLKLSKDNLVNLKVFVMKVIKWNNRNRCLKF